MRVVILGNGKWEQPEAFRSLLRKNDFIIACDGAYEKAKRLRIKVDVVIGDLDSLAAMPGDSKVKILAYPAEKDETDAELALKLALARAPQRILWYGALGDRWDHSLANLFLFDQAARKKVPVEIVQGSWEVVLVLTSCALHGRRGDRVSLLPLSPVVRGISTQGLQFSLNGESLRRECTRGLSNVMTSNVAHVEIKSGRLLALHEKQMLGPGPNKELRSDKRKRARSFA